MSTASDRKVAFETLGRLLTEMSGTFPPSVVSRWFMSEVEGFSDSTVALMSAAVTDPVTGAHSAERMIRLLSRSVRHMESVVRNIAVYAAVENEYREAIGIRDSRHPQLTVTTEEWRTFHPAERHFRIEACGHTTSFETVAQAERMVAGMRVFLAFLTHRTRTLYYPHDHVPYWAEKFINRLRSGEETELAAMLAFTTEHPDRAEQLAAVVEERGIVDREVLLAAAGYTPALISGVL